MLAFTDEIKVYVATQMIDMRKSIDGLSMLVIETLNMNLQSASVFVFHNRSRNKVKVLYWDKNGFVMYYKRLEHGKFKFPQPMDNDNYEISQDQLNWLLAGLDFHLMSLYPELNYTNYF